MTQLQRDGSLASEDSAAETGSSTLPQLTHTLKSVAVENGPEHGNKHQRKYMLYTLSSRSEDSIQVP